MKIVIPPLAVNEGDGFENDLFERQEFGASLQKLVNNSGGELVISLDAKWGEGKTTFIKMWQGLLKESNTPSIYIDAFASDYIDDAFISVVSAITTYADNHIKDKKQLKSIKDQAKIIGGKLLSLSARVGIKAATLGALNAADIESFEEIKSDLASGATSMLNELVEEKINSFTKDQDLIQDFKNSLSNLPKQLNNGSDTPLVVIIDELDRCRPSYAVKLLERVKHLFAVPNVVFVLVMHKKQLEEAVKCIYGQGMDAHTYLQKFIHIETVLPKNTQAPSHISDFSKYSRKLLNLHELNTVADTQVILDSVVPLAKHFDLTLRQLEKVFTNITVLYSTSPDSQERLVPVIVFISIVKVIKPSLLEKLLHKRITYSELCKLIELSDEVDLNENIDNRQLQWIMFWLKYALLSKHEYNALDDEDRLKSFGQSLWMNRDEILPHFIRMTLMYNTGNI